jgi:hypothetical protein
VPLTMRARVKALVSVRGRGGAGQGRGGGGAGVGACWCRHLRRPEPLRERSTQAMPGAGSPITELALLQLNGPSTASIRYLPEARYEGRLARSCTSLRSFAGTLDVRGQRVKITQYQPVPAQRKTIHRGCRRRTASAAAAR